jgi:Rrf2 family transcriptional regulator, nitric oxide-sensitive transcriptional repressor
MRFALQTDFALRTLIYLAVENRRATIGDVAGFYGISAAHVAKVVNQLSRLGYVRSIRGIGGGVELSRAPREISVGEVVLAFEGSLRLLECVGVEDLCVIQPFCKLKSVLAEAERIQVEYLRGVTLEDVLPTRRQTQQVDAARRGV